MLVRILVLLTCAGALPVYGAQWTETVDAGELPEGAQVTAGPAVEALTAINGVIANTQDRDLYRIRIANPTAFSASTVGGDGAFDAILALFDVDGLGVYLNDDGAFDVGDSTLPAGHPLGPSTVGVYYLAIFADETIPVSGAGVFPDDLIFPLPESPFTEVLGPTGGGGAAPITGWVAEGVFSLGASYTINLNGAEFAEVTATAGPVLAAVLPASRSVQVGDNASAFATIINAGSEAAIECGIAPLAPIDANFSFQTTGAGNALTGTPNTPVDIAAGMNQSYVFGFTPTAPLGPLDVELTFDCTNSDPAPITVGLNTLLLVADNGPVPDIVALGATPAGNGIVDLAPSGAFAVATVNVGIADTINVTADTGGANLPLTITQCETNPLSGACINPTTPTENPVTASIAADATPTFSFFVTASDTVPLDPANSRVFVRFRDGAGVTRGSTSVAVQAP